MLTKKQIGRIQENLDRAYIKLDNILLDCRLASDAATGPRTELNDRAVRAARRLESLCSALIFEMTGGPAATEVHHA
jgi:hypothetical protein